MDYIKILEEYRAKNQPRQARNSHQLGITTISALVFLKGLLLLNQSIAIIVMRKETNYTCDGTLTNKEARTVPSVKGKKQISVTCAI